MPLYFEVLFLLLLLIISISISFYQFLKSKKYRTLYFIEHYKLQNERTENFRLETDRAILQLANEQLIEAENKQWTQLKF